MKVLKAFGKIVLVLIVFILLSAGVIFGLRMYNVSKYKPKEAAEENAIYLDPTNLEAYDRNVEGVKIDRINSGYLQGFHLKPDNKSRQGVVVTFGGSEGSPNYEKAVQFSKEGYEVLSLFFFGMENQPKELVQVPLEFFEEVLKYIDENTPDGKPITLYGASKGAELSLNLAVRYPEIDNVVLVAPMDYSYMGLSYSSRELKSSWTWKGEDLPIIDMKKGNPSEFFHMFKGMTIMTPLSYRGSYESAYEKDPNKERARIRVEDTKARILMIAGTDDRMWQSEIAAKNILEKRPENTEALIYEGAGHIFYADRFVYSDFAVLDVGGDLETNTKAGIESDKILLERLNEWHK